MRYILLPLLLLSIGCGKPITIENELIDYVRLFESKHDTKVKTSVEFGVTTLPVVGYCEDSGMSKKIVINKDEFYKFTLLQRENLMLHELGHCELNRDHKEDMQPFNYYKVPVSLMYPYVFNSFEIKAYSSNKEQYLTELYEGKQ